MLVVQVGSNGPGGPVEIAVNTKVRYPMKLRNFLVFSSARGAIRSLTGWYYRGANGANCAAVGPSRLPGGSTGPALMCGGR
jgi:hypothetical protein